MFCLQWHKGLKFPIIQPEYVPNFVPINLTDNR